MPKISAFAALLLLTSAPLAVAQTTSPGASPPAASTSPSTGGSGTTSAPGKMSTQDLKAKLESQGYSDISDVTSTAEGTSAKAMKGGKAVTLLIDSGGNVKETQSRGP